MHRARHSGASSSSLRRSRALILLVAAAVGLATALWLPTRNDSASATENGWDHDRARSHDGDHSSWWWDRHRRRDRHHSRPSASPSESASPAPSESESAWPSASPSKSVPAVSAWKPFTDYVAGQVVSFKGVEYQIQETHTSLPGWEPPALPALFTVV